MLGSLGICRQGELWTGESFPGRTAELEGVSVVISAGGRREGGAEGRIPLLLSLNISVCGGHLSYHSPGGATTDASCYIIQGKLLV